MKMTEKTVAFVTLGCKLNQYESMGIAEDLERYGFRVVNSQSGADYYVINTCTVTGKTDRRSRHAIHRVLTWNPKARIIVTGCGVQRNPEEFSHLSNVILIAGNREKNHIGELLHTIETRPENGSCIQVAAMEHATFENIPISRFRNYTRAFVKIQEGCNRACSYCIIPRVRGPSRSQVPDRVIAEISNLSQRGFKEIVLTGVDLGTYGLDLLPPATLTELLHRLVMIPDLARIRLSSIEPMEFSADLIDFITESPKICRHFHIPLQSGCDSVLKRMNRHYTTADYSHIITSIHLRQPMACLGADVVTAFPGETDEEFQITYDFIRQSPLNHLHVFTYSRRDGTPAVHHKGHIDPQIARDRCHKLRELGHQKAMEFRKQLIGQTLLAITLTETDKETSLPTALSDNYIRILLKGPTVEPGRIIPVTIVECDGLTSYGHIQGVAEPESNIVEPQ